MLGPGGKPLDLAQTGDRVAETDRRRPPRRGGDRHAQPARHHRRARPAPGRDPARVPQVPPARRLALHRELPERRAGRELRDHGEARALLRAALRPGASSPTRPPRRRCATRSSPTSTTSTRSTTTASCATSSTVIDATLRTNAYDRERGSAGLQAPLRRRAGDAAAGAAVRDLRLLARDGGHPPARRQDRARRPALVGPPGLPHRGLRPDARAADQERGDRAGRRQGRLLPQELPAEQAEEVERQYVDLHPLAAVGHRQPGRRRGRAPAGRAGARRGRHLPGRRRRQGHGDVLGHRQPRRAGARLLARRRVRLRRLGRLRPQGARHHRARRVGVGQAPLPRARDRHADRPVHRRRHRRHVRRRVRQRDAAVGQHPARRRVRPPARLHRSRPGPRRGFAERRRLFELAGSSWDDYDRAADLRGRRRLPAHGEGDPAVAAGTGGARHDRRGAAAQRRHPGDPARAGRPAVERRHRHRRQGLDRDRRRRRRPLLGRDPRRRRRAARARRGGGRQPRLHAPRAGRVRVAAAGASTPTSSTTRPASTAPTTRST